MNRIILANASQHLTRPHYYWWATLRLPSRIIACCHQTYIILGDEILLDAFMRSLPSAAANYSSTSGVHSNVELAWKKPIFHR